MPETKANPPVENEFFIVRCSDFDFVWVSISSRKDTSSALASSIETSYGFII